MFSREYDIKGSDNDLRGLFIGKVINADDPKAQERLAVQVLGVHADGVYVWAQHCAYSKNSSGDIPEKDDYVYVMFLDPNNPLSAVWLGVVKTSG